MLVAVLSGFILALAVPWLQRIEDKVLGWIVALLPLGLTVYFSQYVMPIAAGEVFVVSYAWVPPLDIHLSFYLDGLSLLFALLISGIGMLIVLYAGEYLADHHYLGRFYTFILLFMASMLGLVLANNLITLFVFWELTSLSSYLLIGFDYEREAARGAALQAVLVTGVGGLALLAGLLLLGQIVGSLELSVLSHQGEIVRAHPLYLPILLLILVGAFTKSAQAPFHFWLPNAMEAPTPVSAYLHSSTMVKAGVYLLARFTPILGGTDAWWYGIVGIGGTTMLVGAYLSLQQTDLKRLLAYSTVSALGTLMLLLGIGTSLAVTAATVFLVVHALYKGALFLVAGILNHETGTRQIDHLGGLRRVMPLTTAAAALAALSMAGIPPFVGFLGKELLYEAVWKAPYAALPLTGSIVVASLVFVAVAGMVGLQPFCWAQIPTPKTPHEAPFRLWLGPMLLGMAGLVTGIWPDLVDKTLFSSTATAILGQPSTVALTQGHGANPALLLSGLTVTAGLGVYAKIEVLRRWIIQREFASRWGPARLYSLGLDGLNVLAHTQTRVLQSGYLRFYLLTIIASTTGLVGYTLVNRGEGYRPEDWLNVRFYEAGLAGLILLAAVAAVRSRSRLGAIAALGVVGYGVALVYLLFGAPDLTMTQFAIETLTVVLFVLVFYYLPPFTAFADRPARIRDSVVALTTGALMTALVLVTVNVQFHPSISDYFAENSLLRAHGRNIVNVILVDFRGMDTLGEITVLALAGVGVYALVKLQLEKGKRL